MKEGRKPGTQEGRHAGKKEGKNEKKKIKGIKAQVGVGGGEHIRLSLQIQPPIS